MNTPPLLDGLHARMQQLAMRQRVIAQNIANSETPGFKAREVSEPSFAGLVDGMGAGRVATPRVQLTAGMKALGAIEPAGSNGIVADKDISETKPDGNNVTLEDQLLKMGQVQSDFAAMTSIYRKQMAMLKVATGKGSG